MVTDDPCAAIDRYLDHIGFTLLTWQTRVLHDMINNPDLAFTTHYPRADRHTARMIAHAYAVPLRLIDPTRRREPPEQSALHQAYRRRQVARRRRRRAR